MSTSDERPPWATDLILARARRHLGELALREAVNAAVGAGATPRELSEVLEFTPGEVAALLGQVERVRLPDGSLPGDAFAVAERYALGEISRDELRATLCAWPYAASRVMADYWDDIGITAEGSFEATVGRAFDDGLIDGDDYDAIVHARGGPS
jgi:hypothetical protein